MNKQRLLFFVFSFAVIGFNSCRPPKIPAAVIEHLRKGADEIVFKNGALTIPMTLQKDLPMMDVMINGKGPYRFLFDAGASVVSITDKISKDIGLKTLATGVSKSVLLADSIELGTVVFRNVAIVDEKVLDVDGVIGFNLFREGLLTLDYPNQIFSWKNGKLPKEDGVSIFKYRLQERMPYIPLLIGKDTIVFNMDTGASGWFFLPLSFKDKISIKDSLRTGARHWNQDEGDFVTKKGNVLSKVSFGPFEVHNPIFDFSESTPEPLLGSSFFKYFAITFDLRQQTVQFLQKNQAPIVMQE